MNGTWNLNSASRFPLTVPNPLCWVVAVVYTVGKEKYKIAIHRTEEGISVSVPSLPGCWSEGDTEEEALVNIKDAIREYLAALDDRVRDAEIREVEVQV